MSLPLPPFLRKLIYPFVVTFSNKKILSNYQMKNPTTSIYEIPFEDINGMTTNLKSYEGKRILIVNTASACGYTGQYSLLQELYNKFNNRIVVIAFPCNDFGSQESGSDDEIKEFCDINFKVNFPMASKVNILGNNPHPIYKWLTDPKLNGWNSDVPNWNFCKYVIDENGKLLHFLSSAVDPFDERILNG